MILRSNSTMNMDDPNIISKLKLEDLISEHESKSGNYSQSDIQKSYKIEEQKKLEFSDNHHLSPVAMIFIEREIIVVLMFNLIKILIASKNSEMLQTLVKKKLEAC